MNVEPIVGEPSRFLVASRSGQSPHLVDLEENDGKAWCSCEHHNFRLQPLIERGEPFQSCFHVTQARQAQRTEIENEKSKVKGRIYTLQAPAVRRAGRQEPAQHRSKQLAAAAY